MTTNEEAVATATIDEALEKTHFGKFNLVIILFTGLVLKSVVLESVGISFALPILECDLKLSYQQQGMLGAVAFVGIIVSSHLWGFLADTTGRRRIMMPALLLCFSITVASSFSPNFETLLVLRFFCGVLLSAGSATVFAYVGEFHCQKYRNRAIFSAALISATLAIFLPVNAWFFINQNWQFNIPFLNIVYKPWRLYIVACGVPGFICGLWLTYLPESPKYLLTMNRVDEAFTILKRMHRQNTSGSTKLKNTRFDVSVLLPDPDIAAKNTTTFESEKSISSLMKSIWQQTAPLFMRDHIRKTVLCSFLQFIIFFSAHGVYMWFPYILNSSMQYVQKNSDSIRLCKIIQSAPVSNSTYSLVEKPEVCVTQLEISTYAHTLMLEVIYVGLLLCVSYAIGKFGRKSILILILLTCGICGITSIIIKVPLLAIYLFVVQLCCGLGTTVVNSIVVDIYPTNLRAMAVCISLMLGRIGSVVGSNVVGSLIDTSCDAGLLIAAGLLVFAAFLVVPLPSLKLQKK